MIRKEKKMEHRKPIVLRLSRFEAQTLSVILRYAKPPNNWRKVSHERILARLTRFTLSGREKLAQHQDGQQKKIEWAG
jgi:hypothetical protein